MKKEDTITEYCDALVTDGDDTAVDLKDLGVPLDPTSAGQEESESIFWSRKHTTNALRNSIAHQVDYALFWGGVPNNEKGCKPSEMIQATEQVGTHVRVWIESMPLLPL